MKLEGTIKAQLEIYEQQFEELLKIEEESEGECPAGWQGYILQEKIDLLKWILEVD